MRVLVRALSLSLLLLSFTPILRAQFAPQNSTQLIVRVCLDSYENPAPQNLTVQLRDGFGSIEHEGHTDARGVVEFSTFTANKRLRVYGPGILEHEETIEIEPVETRKMILVIVRRDSKNPPMAPPSGTGTVPSSRLAVPDKAQKEFQKGSDALGKKKWAEAETHFEAAIAVYPDYDVAYNGLGMALASSDDPKAARTAFEKAISLNGKFAEAYRNLAKISLSEKNFEETNTLLMHSLTSDPLNAWALTYAAYAELQLHKFEDAIAHAQKAHTMGHKGLASCHTVAALALEATGKPAEAISEYQAYLAEEHDGRDAERAREAIARLSGTAPK